MAIDSTRSPVSAWLDDQSIHSLVRSAPALPAGGDQ